MRHLVYAMRLTGQATPAGAAGAVFKAATSAPCSTLTSTAVPDGLGSSWQSVESEEASFVSEVIFLGKTRFHEAGTIAFGDGDAVHFATVESGYVSTSPDPTCQHGTVMWRVEGGEGQFAGASGLITSNFLVCDTLAVTDHHIGVLWVP
jgi:hypothetical protein